MSAPLKLKYRAFLSYAHADLGQAKWLHRQLEGFHIDKNLAGRQTVRGPVPASLRPIFRDREDFSGGETLASATVAALDASEALIVLCSGVAAARPAVNEEVRLFRWRHPDRPVIPVILDGAYPENFPPALRFETATDGMITERPVTIHKDHEASNKRGMGGKLRTGEDPDGCGTPQDRFEVCASLTAAVLRPWTLRPSLKSKRITSETDDRFILVPP